MTVACRPSVVLPLIVPSVTKSGVKTMASNLSIEGNATPGSKTSIFVFDTGGFKATPGSGWAFAHTIANDAPHPLNAPFSLDRFYTGHLIDEHGAAAVAH